MLKFVIAYTESGRDLKQAQIIQPVSRTQVKHRRAYISGWRLEAGGWRLEAGGQKRVAKPKIKSKLFTQKELP